MTDTSNPFAMWATMWSRMMPDAGASEERDSPSDLTRMMSQLTDAHVATVEAGYRYMANWADLSGTAYPLVMKLSSSYGQAGATDDAEVGRMMDELRAVYRKMADLPRAEAARLETELSKIWEEGASEQADAPAETTDPDAPGRSRPKRGHRTKD